MIPELPQPLDPASPTPLYEQLRQGFTDLIAKGQLAPGAVLPSIRELSESWKVGQVTVRRALRELSRAGLVKSQRGSGTVVTAPPADETPLSLPRQQRIGIVFADFADGYPFIRPMVEAVETQASGDAGPRLRLQLLHLPLLETDGRAVRHALPLEEVDGLILMSPVNLALLNVCQRQDLPYVLVYNQLSDGLSHCIVPDYVDGILDAVRRLHQFGRRRLALVTASELRFSTGQMTDAFRISLQINNLEFNPGRILHAGYDQQQGYEATRRLLGSAERPDAILYASDHQACGGLLAASEAQLRVPEDLAIVGTGNLLRPFEWPLRLATIDLHTERLARLATDTLVRLIQREPDVPMRQTVPSTYRPGETA